MRDGRDLSVIFERSTIRDTFRISYLANRLVLPAYDDIKLAYGLSRGEYLLLFCLSYIEELTAQDVAEMTGRPRNSISRAVHRMLDEGYLKRSPDPTDGRQALLRITAKGERLHKRILPLFEEQEAKMLDNLTSEERKLLDSLLKKLVLRD
ncbi:MAG: MarR family transcriptional regulator [Pseudomonadota bacterium]|jgi:DNA-binding MarR family transcriptional regulator|nr:MarR family transcriptional regulator [Pseudomonadota bacterium]MEC8200125.1 MarR family transcriptional regulator [Pseudomonadota bacterium]MEC8202000.1 MarR family transcriptional regulator [Pseudomonadota bacterium]MEC8697830.1 MarR family transcriptional regulator [Pseudomonadota bacterium]